MTSTRGPGSRLGPYEVVSALGAGGMGEVYRARDARLNRDVAIKVLPQSLAYDDAALARFEREAQAVAALSHPNILAIHDFVDEGGLAYAVTELLEGETLRARLDGGALPPRKAVEIAISLARGLAAAHARGIVHRDLKPENIFITSDSVVKILDFGLARTHDSGAGGSAADTRLASDTTPGTVMGTVGYMAPEQVRGQAVDARGDLFALGAVLYEMLAGERAFQRETAADTMTAILKEDAPEFPAARAISPALDRIVRHCLEKQPGERFQTARDVAFALEALSGSSASSAAAAVRDVPARGVAGRHERLAWASVTVALVAVAGWLLVSRPAGGPPADGVRRASLLLPEGYDFRLNTAPSRRMAISPDGRRVAYALAQRGSNESTLFVHSLDQDQPVAVPDSAPASAPFWSPDGRLLGFLKSGQVMITDSAGGRPSARAAASGRAVWGAAGDLLQADSVTRTLRLLKPGDSEWRDVGGAPAADARVALINPVWLPDGRRFLVLLGVGGADSASLYLGDTSGAPWRLVGDVDLTRESSNVSYVAGQLLNVRDRMVVARSLDPDHPGIGTEAIVLAGPVDGALRGSANFAVSESALVYQPVAASSFTRLVWYDRSGARLSQVSDDAGYSNLELSPDGSQLLVGVLDAASGGRDIWVVDLKRGVRSRLTSDPADERSASWFPDGTSIVFHGRNRDLFARPAGPGVERPVQIDGRSKDPRGVSPDGRYVVYRVSGEGIANNDIWIKPLNPEGEAKPFLATAFNESYAELSPDGRWMAYVSDESERGQGDVYVTAFPSGAGKLRVSPAGGGQPRWRRDGRELFYMTEDRMLMRVSVSASGSTLSLDTPTPLFQTESDRGPGPQFIVTPDGQRFLVNTEVSSSGQGTLSVVFNWRALLTPRGR